MSLGSARRTRFPPERDLADFTEYGFAVRHSLQFHWRNRGYSSFSDYLEALTSKRRSQISASAASSKASPSSA